MSASEATLPVTVVIPAFNRRSSIAETIESARRQTLAPADVMVVDDASDDGTAAFAEELGCTVLRRSVNGGSAAARNVGLERVTTPWVAFLDSDDVWDAELLETLWPYTDEHVLVSGAAVLQVGGRPVTLLGTERPDGQLLASPMAILDPANPIVTSATLVRTDVVRELGGFDTGLRISEDLDLWLRVLERGTGWCHPKPLMRYHRGESSKSQKTDGSVERARVRIALRHRSAPWWTFAGAERYAGSTHWEGARTSARGRHPAGVLRHLGRATQSNRRIEGVLASVRRNWRLRQRFRRLEVPDGH